MKISVWIISLFFALSIVACSHQSSRDARTTTNAVHYGQVSAIEILDVESEAAGSAVVFDAVGGAIATNGVENGHDSDIYCITVVLENGGVQKFNYADFNNLRVGDRVKVQNGQINRR